MSKKQFVSTANRLTVFILIALSVIVAQSYGQFPEDALCSEIHLRR